MLKRKITKFEKQQKVVKSEKAKVIRSKISNNKKLTLHDVPTPEIFKKNKYYIEDHTFSYNLKPDDGDYAKIFGFKIRKTTTE